MLHKSHKYPALLAAGVLLLSLNSCGPMEMRDSYVETEQTEESAERMLAPAERVNQVIERPVEEEIPDAPTAEDRTVTVTFTGNVAVDTHIVTSAADNAYTGQDYSFLTMYTGLYSKVSEADLAGMSYTTADHLADKGDEKPPVESCTALSTLGADILNVTGCQNVCDTLTEQGICGISAENGTVETLEIDGVTFGFAAVGDVLDVSCRELVKNTADASDIAVISVNWQDETPQSDRDALLWNLAEAGADIIIGQDAELGSIQWLDTGNGHKALAVSSLGNILSTAEYAEELLGGVLTFCVTDTPSGSVIDQVILTPTFTHYNAEYRDYQVFRVADYSDELAADHAIDGVYTSVLCDMVRDKVSAEFLPADLIG